MKKLLSVLLILVLLVGCGGTSEPDAPEANGKKEIGDLKIAAFFTGPRGDSGTVDMISTAVEGLERDYGTTIRIIEGADSTAIDIAKMQSGLLDLIEDDYDIIITEANELIEVAGELAKDNKNTTFMFFDSVFDFETYPADTVYSASYKQNEGAFLAGALAMLNSDNNHIGFVGGVETTVILDFLWGYVEGAKAVEPEGSIEVSFTGDWYDSAKAKEIALTEYKMGAEVIFPAAGPSSEGVMQAGAEEGFYTIGVDIDRVDQYKDTRPTWAEQVLSSEVKNIEQSVIRAIELYVEGTLPVGKVEYLGIKENGVGLIKGADYESKNSAEVRAKIDELEAKVTSGEIEVGTAYGKSSEELTKFKNSIR